MCSVRGCFGTTIDDEVCPECRQQIDALEQWGREQETRRLCRAFRRQERAERWRRVAHSALKRIWVPELIFVGGALVYLGCVFGEVFLEWLGVR